MVHVYALPPNFPINHSMIPSPATPTPMLPLYSIETNALGYCKCSLLELSNSQALLAVPSTLKDDFVNYMNSLPQIAHLLKIMKG